MEIWKYRYGAGNVITYSNVYKQFLCVIQDIIYILTSSFITCNQKCNKLYYIIYEQD